MAGTYNAEPNQPPGEYGHPFARFFRQTARHLRSKTINGLMELLPLLVTILVLGFIVGYADNLVRPLTRQLPWEIPFIGAPDFTGVGIILLTLLFYLSGAAVSCAMGRRSFDVTGRLLNNTPIVGSIYGLTQTVAAVMSSQYRFSRVVFIEWPREGMLALGFVTGRAVSRATGESMVIVYVPTVPNPTSGNMAVVIEDDIIETDMNVEDAMKMVFSGGIVIPPSMAFARVQRARGVDEFLGRFDNQPR